jgi:hypothetical protein
MATHNIDDGTGGLDGSIAFELDRAQVCFAHLKGLAANCYTGLECRRGDDQFLNRLSTPRIPIRIVFAICIFTHSDY